MTHKDIKILEVANKASDIQEKGDTEFRLRLTQKPDSTWSHAFDEAYNSVKWSMWRSANVVGREILICCHHSQLKETYIPPIQSAIDVANDKSKRISEAYARDMEKNEEEEAKRRQEKQNILNELNDQFK